MIGRFCLALIAASLLFGVVSYATVNEYPPGKCYDCPIWIGYPVPFIMQSWGTHVVWIGAAFDAALILATSFAIAFFWHRRTSRATQGE
jgi:hypothetical protein